MLVFLVCMVVLVVLLLLNGQGAILIELFIPLLTVSGAGPAAVCLGCGADIQVCDGTTG